MPTKSSTIRTFWTSYSFNTTKR